MDTTIVELLDDAAAHLSSSRWQQAREVCFLVYLLMLREAAPVEQHSHHGRWQTIRQQAIDAMNRKRGA